MDKIPVIHVDTFEWKGYHYFVRVLEGGEMQLYSHEKEKWETIHLLNEHTHTHA